MLLCKSITGVCSVNCGYVWGGFAPLSSQKSAKIGEMNGKCSIDGRLPGFAEKFLEKAWGGVYNHPSPNQVVRLEIIAIISGHAQPPKGIFVKLLFARIEKCPR